MFAGLGRPFDRDQIAVGVGEYAEPALELREILVILPEDQRGVAIILENEVDFGGFGLAGEALGLGANKLGGAVIRFQIGASRAAWPGAMRPNSEFAPAATISTGQIRPMRSLPPSTWTAC